MLTAQYLTLTRFAVKINFHPAYFLLEYEGKLR
jgi:hypothetical protein